MRFLKSYKKQSCFPQMVIGGFPSQRKHLSALLGGSGIVPFHVGCFPKACGNSVFSSFPGCLQAPPEPFSLHCLDCVHINFFIPGLGRAWALPSLAHPARGARRGDAWGFWRLKSGHDAIRRVKRAGGLFGYWRSERSKNIGY